MPTSATAVTASPGTPDLSNRGDGFERDSFCLALQEAARVLGKDIDYTSLLALTTNAFAPGFDTGNDCKELWVANAWVSHVAPLDAARGYLGLAVEPIPFPNSPAKQEDETASTAHRRQCVEMIRAAMAEGKVVVITGGWEHQKQWVEPWWAGIVTQVTDDGVVLGAHLNGRTDNELASFTRGEVFAVSLTKPTISDDQLNPALLQAAIDRIRAQGEHFQRREFCAFGADAIDEWIKQMSQVAHFCPPCQAKASAGHKGAMKVAQSASHRAQEAVAFLRARIDTFPSPARAYVDAAAAHYDRIVALLKPTLTGDGDERYQAFVGDLVKQKAHADNVLTPVKAELLAVANSMAAALDAMQTIHVRREGDRVWIDNVPPSGGEGNRYVRGIETMLAHAGTPVSYERLMGLSGVAFITQADAEHRWEGKVDVGWWPLDAWGLQLRRAFLGQAVGYELNEAGWVTCTPEQFLAMRDHLPQVYRELIEPHVTQSIDAGRPVLATADFGFVIMGYDNATDKPPLLGRCAGETQAKLDRLGQWPIGLLFLGQRREPMDRDAADVAALRFAVALARDQAGPYEETWRNRRFTGQKAYAAWSSLLRNMKEPVEDRHHANMKLHLRINRTAAVAYVRSVAERRPDAAALRDATAAYGRALELIAQIKPAGLSEDVAKRRDLADLVDRIAAVELEAAQYLERAVIQMTVKRDNGKVWIDGVQGFHPGEFASSMHGVWARMGQAIGEGPSYDELICYGGLAFRVQVHEAMCPSAAHPCCGYKCFANSERALPWKMQTFFAFPWGKPIEDRPAFEAQACAAIKASIDRGIPVHYGSEEDGLIIGYADEGRRWWCVHPYHKGGGEAFWHDEVSGFAGSNGQWPWGLGVWAGPRPQTEHVSPRDLTLAALRQAVDMWRTEKQEAYFCGDAAYTHWLNWLREVESGADADPKGKMQGNGWCFDTLVHYRRIAGPWLRAQAELFDGEARTQLLVAADHYAQLVDGCVMNLECPWSLAPGPDKHAQWTSGMRQDQIGRLEAAREHDLAAIAAIERALPIIEGANR